MAKIEKIKFDLANRKLVVIAKSTGIESDSNNIQYYNRFEKIYVDTSCTINGCINEPSSNAPVVLNLTNDDVKFKINPNGGTPSSADLVNGVYYNGDLINYEILFDDVNVLDFLSKDVENELLLVWVEEVQYVEDANHEWTPTGIKNYKAHALCISGTTLYDIFLNKIKINSEDCCKTSCADVNFFLAWNGFKFAAALEDYRKAVYYWKIIHNTASEPKNCGCNG